jgi:citrate synthase
MNASTFAALVTASTITGFPDAEAAADLTLNGRLHGGAADEVADMLTEVGSPENVAAYVAAKRSARQKIPGFGHRVYKVKDPRAGILQGLLEKLLESPEFQKDEVKHSYILNRYRTALAIENALVKLGEDKNVWPNVDLYSSILEEALGVPTKQRASSGKIIVHPGFSPTFALGRKAGRLARVREYFLQPTVTGDMFRPSQVYTGKREQRYVPMAHR